MGAALLSLALRADEGYDPMRQISTQIARTNLLVVLDVSGSMAWNLYGKNGQNGDVNSIGGVPSAAWSSISHPTTRCDDGGWWTTPKYDSWWVTLTVTQKLPARINTVKNALGNSVSIYTQWAPPASLPAITNDDWRYATVTGPVESNGGDGVTHYWQWTYTVTTSCVYSSDNSVPTGTPFSISPASGADVLGGQGGDLQGPLDLVGNTGGPTGSVNWGLEIFSDNKADCTKATLVAKIDSNDTGDVTTIESNLRLQSAGGLNVGGGTPTRGALNFAKTVISATYDGGTFTDKANTSFTLPADPKKNCGRLYGVILVTDGMSNTCNTSSGECWPSVDGSCTYCADCDAGTRGPTCPQSYALFPAGMSEAIWNLSFHPHVWTIGISPVVGKCELNYTAYKGRGDAYAADAGTIASNDPRLPEGTPGTYDDTQDYAYFANTASSIKSAFDAIIAGLGAGDYTTSAPAMSASSVATAGSVGFVASSEYPGWKGHLYAYDLNSCDLTGCTLTSSDCTDCPSCDKCTGTAAAPVPASDAKLLWDAGDVLSNHSSVGTSSANGRSIWTWNPATKALIEIQGGVNPSDSSILTTVTNLNGICSTCGITTDVVDFIRGDTGAVDASGNYGTKRAWLFGSSMNSSPAIIGSPAQWKQSTLPNHGDFELNYAQRHPLVWIGSDDGMLHAFDIVDGKEVIALLPPEFLANQVTLFNNYKANSGNMTGQPPSRFAHIYGVANSPRFADMNLGTVTHPDYRTVILLASGPGYDTSTASTVMTNAITAIDVTHPYAARTAVVDPSTGGSKDYPADYDYSSTAPVGVLWRYLRSGSGTVDPYLSWSIPAVAANSTSTWKLGMGSGFDPKSTAASSLAPKLITMEGTGGTSITSTTLTKPTGTPLVGDQAFADCVYWERGASFREDNVANEFVQADLAGQLSRWDGSTLDRTISQGVGQPLYYSPAVGAFTLGTTAYAVYAYSSGCFYEKSPNVTGVSVGTTGNFIPKLYVSVQQLQYDTTNKIWTLKAGSLKTWSKIISDIPTPENILSGGTNTSTLGARTEPVTSPLLLIPSIGSTTSLPYALFLLYDPDVTGVCAGKTYAVQVDIDVTKLGAPGDTTGISSLPAAGGVSEAGIGAASGFIVSQNQIYVAMSGVGANAKAKLKKTNKKLKQGNSVIQPNYWIELK